MVNSSDDSSLSSPPSPSASSSAGGGRKRSRGDRGGSGRGGGRSRGGGDGGGSVPPPRPRPLVPAAPAPSDWDELRAHYRFVLPDDAEGRSAPEASGGDVPGEDDGRRYGATWQERMVKHYHSHLYKEYVLADLSRVPDLGKVGLRWRTAKEVASGRGFRTCGNLKCPGGGDVARAATDEERKAYAAAARRATGIAVPENGGREPLGVALPGSAEDRAAVDRYLASCARERDGAEREDGDGAGDGEEGGKRRKKEKKKKRSRSRRGESESRLDAERREVDRLERLAPPGAGLHDYEADFAYVEAGARKRELVKVRLCLRCAPLLFAAKRGGGGGGARRGVGEGEERGAPATKAREAREEAARERAAAAATAGAPEAAGS